MEFGLNIFYLVLSVHTFIHEHILVQTLGLERKQYAYRVLLPHMEFGYYWPSSFGGEVGNC